MEMTLLSITVWFTHFLIASALYFNTLPTNTMSDSTEITQITQATTKTRQEPKILTNTTSFLPQTTKAQENTTNLPSEIDTLPNTTPNVASTQETTTLHQYNSSTPSHGMMDDGIGISNTSSVAMSHTNTSHTTVSTNFARVTLQNNETVTVTMSSVSYTDDGQTVHTVDTLSDLLSSVSTVPWKDRTEKEGDRTKADEGNYETNSTQATFANTNESRGTLSTEGSYSITSEHREEPYDTTANTIGESAATATTRNDWSTSKSTDIPMITPASTTAQDPTVTEYHTSIGGVNHSMTQQNINRFTNSTAHTGRENITGTDTPTTTTYNNNSIITGVLTDATNKTDSESKAWHKCLNPNPKSRQFTLMCFITLWTLAMFASLFLGITIFLWVRLSVFKKKRKHREKGGQTCEKESLWADPKASVQERVEFWYVNGSTMEADRKQKDRKRQERMKKRGQEQDRKENGLWIQPKVTVDDITEFWYANRRMKEERVPDTDT